MKIDRIHHVAYRCRDAKGDGAVVRQDAAHGLSVLAIAEDQVPHQASPTRTCIVFLDAAGQRARLLRVADQAADGRPETPEWVQHIAFKVKTARRCSPTAATWRPTAWTCWASPTTGRSTRSTSSTPTGTGGARLPGPRGSEDARAAGRGEVGDARGVEPDQARATAGGLPARARVRAVTIAHRQPPSCGAGASTRTEERPR